MNHWTKQINPDILIIAEVKEYSPFGHSSNLSSREMLVMCEDLGDVISIHTDPLWGGSWEWLETARRLTSKPILAKGFHNTINDVNRAFNLGADYCLTVGWYPGDKRCWHECESLEELEYSAAHMAVWNSRNPRTGADREVDIKWARAARGNKLLCQASNIRSVKDVGQVDAVLIGAGLYK